MSITIFQNEKTPFQAKKTKSSKSPKIDIIPKGLTHGFRPKMAIFPNFSFQAIQARKMSFTIFYNEKTRFQAIKTRSQKSRKTDIFTERLTNGFCPKMTIIPTCFFRQQRQGKCLSRYLAQKKAFLGYRNKKFKKSKNSHFSKGVNPSFWSKNGHFSKLFFLGNIGKETVFRDILEQKKAFLGYKNKKFKKSKN